MRFPTLFLFFLSAVLLSAETKILLNKSASSVQLAGQQITVPQGERVVITVPVLSGNVWFKNAQPVQAGGGNEYVIESASLRDAGRYRVGYMSDGASATQELMLSVGGVDSTGTGGRLHTFTTRGVAGSGAQSLVAGFAIGETAGQPSATKRVLVRAVGPTLEDFGQTGFLRRPQLAVYDATGNRIQDSTTEPLSIARATLRTGAFPLRANGGDAVLLLTLQAGTYTAQISGSYGDTGVVLLDVREVPTDD